MHVKNDYAIISLISPKNIMSRTKRSIKNANPNARRVGNKLADNKAIEITQDLGLAKGHKFEKFAPDDFKISAWKENVHLKWVWEDGFHNYYLHGRLMVSLTPEEDRVFPFQHFFGEYAAHLS